MVWRLPFSPDDLLVSKRGDRLYGPLARGIYDTFATILETQSLFSFPTSDKVS